jgi:hypothetical protein
MIFYLTQTKKRLAAPLILKIGKTPPYPEGMNAAMYARECKIPS